MAAEYFDVTWGRTRLWCSSIQTDNSRTQVVHELSTGDTHPVQDRGLAPRRVRCELLFVDMHNEKLSALERFLIFKGQVDNGNEEVFTHPIDGSYPAKVGEFNYTIDEDGNFADVTAEFIAADEVVAVNPAGPGQTTPTGIDAVQARADELLADMTEFEIDSTIPADAIAAVDAWTSGDTVPTRDIVNQTADLSEQLSSFIEDEGLEDDLELWDVYRSTILLGDAIRSAALAATSETASIFIVKIAAPTSVLGLAARTYGGLEAEDRERQIRNLNDIRTTSGLLEPGMEIAMPARSSSRTF